MPQGPQAPKYVVPTHEFGMVTYPTQSAVGFQFVNPNGEQVFVAFPGSFIPDLAKQLSDLVEKNPAVLSWQPPSIGM